MIRNPFYVYGDQNPYVPADRHLGKYVLDSMNNNNMKGDTALTNVEDGSTYTFGDVAQQAVNVALSLARLGVRRGTLVAVCSEPGVELLSSILGILCSGATVVSVDGIHHEDIVQKQLSCTKATILFASKKFYRKLQRVLEVEDQFKTIVVFEDRYEPGSRVISFSEFLTETATVESYIVPPVNGLEDVALICFSSGTTGLFKAIQITHDSILVQINSHNRMKRGDRVLFLPKWSSAYAVEFALGSMCSGANLFIIPHGSTTPTTEDDISIVYNYIDQHKINVLQLTAVMAYLLSTVEKHRGEYDLSSLKLLMHVGVPLDVRCLKKLQSLSGGAELKINYGLSETGSICINDSTKESSDLDGFTDKSKNVGQITSLKNKCDQEINFNSLGIVSVGRPCPGITLKIADLQSGKTLGPNLLGEICVKSRGMCSGYANKKMELKDGWLHTGDAGGYDTQGYVYMYDRVTDLIHIGGSIVSPSVLEGALSRFPGVRDAAVALRENKLMAFVQLLDGASVAEHDLQKYVENLGIEGAALTGGVRTVSRVPRSLFGKMDRRALQDLE